MTRLMFRFKRGIALLICCCASIANAERVQITVHPDQVIRPVNPCLRGICIEDVNHEIYGGIYSQLVFGESFQEPGVTKPVKDFHAFGGDWILQDGVVSVAGGDGPKLVSNHTPIAGGTTSLELRFDNDTGENAGLILGVNKPGAGADAFDGYELSLDPGRKILRLARHQHNYQLIRDVPCDVPVGQWIALKVRLGNSSIAIDVDGKPSLQIKSRQETAPGTVGLRSWRSQVSFRNLSIQPNGGPAEQLPFSPSNVLGAISGMWHPVLRGNAVGRFSLETEHAFTGSQSQRMSFDSGTGEVGIANRGLNGWGMNFVSGKSYDGYLWVKSEKPTTLLAALESGDGSKVYAEQSLNVSAGDWRRVDVALTPNTDDHVGRFAIKMKDAASVTIGHAFLQPGEWGRFKGLPVRKDVADAIIDQGVAVIRYGGSMVNSPNYRWKHMYGSRDRRPPYNGTWYPYSSNGWSVVDFLNFCEAAGIVGIPDLNVNEDPSDLAEFIEYVNGSADTAGGRMRATDGHPAPYRLKHLEIGNEEKVDSVYAAKFAAIAEAIWSHDPDITLIVGDFGYHRRITDPDRVTGSDGGITNFDGHRRILELAKRQNREVWFDIHIWAEQLRPSDNLRFAASYMDTIEKVANGAKYRVLTFELNANSHGLMRGLANAMTVNTLLRDNRMPIITSANGLQPDGQNDNGWDQGLIFLNPSQVWLQSPGYVARMQARNQLPQLVQCDVNGSTDGRLDVLASRSENGKSLELEVVNLGEAASVTVDLGGFVRTRDTARVTELTGALDAVNTAEKPQNIVSKQSHQAIDLNEGSLHRELPAHSFTIMRFE